MPTNSSSKSGAVCKTCSKPGFKDASGKMQHERRGDPSVYGGRRADPKAAGKGASGPGGGSSQEREPEREHILSRRIGGKREE